MLAAIVAVLGGGAALMAATSPEDVGPTLQVPIKGVSDDAWLAFVKVHATQTKVTPTGRYGRFELSVPRLTDLGVMRKSHYGNENGRSLWAGEWNPPYTERRFLDDKFLQYRLFAESCGQYADDETVLELVGKLVDGDSATLSGLLSVANRAGVKGLSSWFTDAKERETFSKTTELFKRANGIF
jgi:hypothetical protein